MKMMEPDDLGRARNEMREAIRAYRTGRKYLIPMTKQAHPSSSVLPKLFFEFAYQDQNDPDKREPAEVTYRYQGREKSLPVRLCVLQKRPTALGFRQTPLRVGLISMRHLRMDHIVDMYWFVNQDIMAPENSDFREPENSDFRAKDDYCYKVSQKQLEELVIKQGIRRIHLYLTGYPAGVIGFYRALIAYLYEQQKPGSSYPSIEVTPYYFYNSRELYYRRGDPWS